MVSEVPQQWRVAGGGEEDARRSLNKASKGLGQAAPVNTAHRGLNITGVLGRPFGRELEVSLSPLTALVAGSKDDCGVMVARAKTIAVSMAPCEWPNTTSKGPEDSQDSSRTFKLSSNPPNSFASKDLTPGGIVHQAKLSGPPSTAFGAVAKCHSKFSDVRAISGAKRFSKLTPFPPFPCNARTRNFLGLKQVT